MREAYLAQPRFIETRPYAEGITDVIRDTRNRLYDKVFAEVTEPLVSGDPWYTRGYTSWVNSLYVEGLVETLRDREPPLPILGLPTFSDELRSASDLRDQHLETLRKQQEMFDPSLTVYATLDGKYTNKLIQAEMQILGYDVRYSSGNRPRPIGYVDAMGNNPLSENAAHGIAKMNVSTMLATRMSGRRQA